MRRMIVLAASWVIWSATVRVSSARKRQWLGSQKRTFCKASHQLVGEMFRRSSLPSPPADEGPLWPPCHAIVLGHDRNGLARNQREQQKESQLRDIERIRNKKAELWRKAEVPRCQGAGERGQDANSAAVMHRHHDHRQ